MCHLGERQWEPHREVRLDLLILARAGLLEPSLQGAGQAPPLTLGLKAFRSTSSSPNRRRGDLPHNENHTTDFPSLPSYHRLREVSVSSNREELDLVKSRAVLRESLKYAMSLKG